MRKIVPFVIMNLKRRQLRSYLTIIGIIVGVIAIVSLLSLSEGLKTGITQEFSKTGAQRISISSKYSMMGQGSSAGLNLDDVKVIEKIGEVDFATGYLNSQSISKFAREEKQLSLTGYQVENYENILTQEGKKLLRGKYIDSDKASEIVIGYDLFTSDQYYGKIIKIGDTIEISNKKFKVVGVLDDTGNVNADRKVYMSLENLREISNAGEKEVDGIYAIAKGSSDIETTGNEIEKVLEKFRDQEDFVVTTPIKEAESRAETLQAVSIVVVGIAAISLLVGGIGILNSMYTSVLERRKEIGVMKAIGARREDILGIFLIEAGIIGLIGGIIGTIGGFLIAFMVNIIGQFAGTEINVSFDITIILVALGFSFILGLLAGFLPAYQASKQQAIDSLREE
jgi:putative ABC transport system permease protein